MRFVFILLLVFMKAVTMAQTDSLELKLQQYKSLYEKGLITTTEYQALREKELKITLKVEEKRDTARRHNFNVRIAPVFYGAVWRNQKDRYYSSSGKVTNVYEGGLHLEAGPVIKKRHAINAAIGFEGGRNTFHLPIYLHYHVCFTGGKVAPYLHVGFGYALIRYKYPNYGFDNYNGFVAPVGVGANFKLSGRMDMAVSADYRALCVIQQRERTNTQNPEGGGAVYNSYQFLHEVGIRLQFIFH